MNEPGRVSVCKVRYQKSLRISDVLFASKKESGNLGKDNEKSSKQRQEV